MIRSLGIIGSGNTAWQLAHHFVRSQVPLKFIASRNLEKATELAQEIGVESFELNDIPKVDLLFICVTDSAIAQVSKLLIHKTKSQVHCCGSVGLDSLEIDYRGVFYPLQTMTKGRFLVPEKIPICIEAANKQLENELVDLASKCRFESSVIDSHSRQKAHISAVMVNNFTNHVLNSSFKWADKNQLDKNLLLPLALETIEKAFALGGKESQTGPARRNNTEIISHHIQELSGLPKTQALYDFISRSIINEFERS